MTDLARSGGWIARAALIKVDTARKSVQLLKPTPDQLNGSVRKAKLARNSGGKMVLRWVVTGTRSKSNQTTPAFNYRAMVQTDTGAVSVIAKPIGYGNDFRASGSCKIS
ncbi:hypothetical protein [Litoreibacter ponti]|nr:hypothetical protein [Litoreibacter ponti]